MKRFCAPLYLMLFVLAVLPSMVWAQSPANLEHLQPLTLNIVATDRAGNRVPDLRAEDLKVLDEGSVASIVSLRPASGAIPPLVILLDLMSLSYPQAQYEAKRLGQELAQMPAGGSVYLYLLDTNGISHPVHPIPTQFSSTPDNLWLAHSATLIEEAVENASRLKRKDIVEHPVERLKIVYDLFGNLGESMSDLPGQKQLLWITYGVTSAVNFKGNGIIDVTDRLRQLAAEFNRHEIAIYALDPGTIMGTYNREGLYVLTDSTGGRTFGSSDFTAAIGKMRSDASSSYKVEYASPSRQNAKVSFRRIRVASLRKGVHLIGQQVYLPR